MKPRDVVMQRRLEIKKLIEEIGLWNLDKVGLGKRYDVSRQMIDKDVHAIMKGVPNEQLEEIRFNLITAYKKGMREMQKTLATSTDNNEKSRAAQVLGGLGKQYTEMLEAYGLKEKVPDEQNVTVQGVKVSIVYPESRKKE